MSVGGGVWQFIGAVPVYLPMDRSFLAIRLLLQRRSPVRDGRVEQPQPSATHLPDPVREGQLGPGNDARDDWVRVEY